MRLLLVHPHHPYPGRDRFPLSLGYLAAVAEEWAGAEVLVVDEQVERLGGRVLREFEPDVVGVTCTTPAFGRVRELISFIRSRSEALVLVGGSHPTFLPEQVVLAGADAAVRGEGELTLVEVLEGAELSEVRGLSYRAEEGVVHNPERELIANLDELPHPAWHLFPLREYRIMSLVTARGCTYSCVYCAASRFWRRRVRFRSPGSVVEEVRELYNLGFRRLRFMDSTFTLDRERALEICRRISGLGLRGLSWSCETRADHLDEEVVRALRDAGCTLVCVGVDSGSDEVLRRCRRGMRAEQVRRGLLLARRAGLKVRAYITFGFPGESEESVRCTLRLLRETMPEQVLLSLATAYPGTELEPSPEAPHESWVRKFPGHGAGAELYIPESLTLREYMRLGDVMYEGVRELNRRVRAGGEVRA